MCPLHDVLWFVTMQLKKTRSHLWKTPGNPARKQHQYGQLWVLNYGGICSFVFSLTHWGRVTLIRVNKIITIGSDIWTNAGILLIRPLAINFNDMLIETKTFSFKKMHLKSSSVKWRLFRLGFNELNNSKLNISPSGHYWKDNAGTLLVNHSLTKLLLDKMVTISQMTFSNAFSWMKSFIFWLYMYNRQLACK